MGACHIQSEFYLRFDEKGLVSSIRLLAADKNAMHVQVVNIESFIRMLLAVHVPKTVALENYRVL